jgi:hypothetical protein
VFDGPINGESFRAYVEQQLVRVLRPGDIVVMDNLGSHKSPSVRQMIQKSRCQAVVPAAVLTRPQPDRASLCEDQALDAHRTETRDRRRLRPHRPPRQKRHPTNAATISSMPDTLPPKHETL